MKAIIEHLEPEVYPWCVLEYRHISQILGKENVIFTNVPLREQKKIKEFGDCFEESYSKLRFRNVCLLDPKAEEQLEPSDGDHFEYFLFGGILGNNPPQGRTKKAFGKLDIPLRGLGDKQMSTDTAVNVTHKIVDLDMEFTDLEFIDGPDIVLDEGYSNELPYRYLAKDGKPILPEGLIDFLQSEE